MANTSWAGDATGGGATTDKTLAQLIAAESSCQVGDVGKPTDSPYTLLCRAAGTWSYTYPRAQTDVTPPIATGWSDMNGGTGSFSGGIMNVAIAAAAGVDYKGQIRSLPAAPYHIIVGWNAGPHGGEAAIGLKAAAGAPIIVATIPAAQGRINIQKYTSFTAHDSNYLSIADIRPKEPRWFMLEDDGTDRNWLMSTNRAALRADWTPLRDGVDLNDDFIDPDQVFIGGYPALTEFGLSIGVFDLEITAGVLS